METLRIESTGSTNTWVKQRAGLLTPPLLAYAVAQTAGRGQRGNSWEAEPGMNLTASAFFVPEGVEARCQFAVSEAVALAVVDFLKMHGVAAKVKWPNDIYAGDGKICGILIENSLLGSKIMHTVAGIGINLNQTVFRSDAPNPVSIRQITGGTTAVPEAAIQLAACLETRIAGLAGPAALHEEYTSLLWRGSGLHPFFDRIAGQRISASISRILPDGTLTLSLADGSRRSYAFKEVEFLFD